MIKKIKKNEEIDRVDPNVKIIKLSPLVRMWLGEAGFTALSKLTWEQHERLHEFLGYLLDSNKLEEEIKK